MKTSRLAAALWACGVLGAAAQTSETAIAVSVPPASTTVSPLAAATAVVPSVAPGVTPAAGKAASAPAEYEPAYIVPGSPVLLPGPAAPEPAPAAPQPVGTHRDAGTAAPAPAVATPQPAGDAPPANPLTGSEAAPLVEDAPDTPAARQDLWGRVRQSYAMTPLQSDLVRKWEQYYATKPDYLQRMFERGGRYLFYIVEEVTKRGMPAELALLPFIESAFNPLAQSSARASGMWQFMPATGRHFELRQNVFRDDRRSVIDSTRAALDYLMQLNGMFGDWQLALAAYNWGQGNVARAQANNRRLGKPAGYGDLSMPDETRNYVPKLLAFANLVSRPQDFGVQLPPLENHPYFLTVRVDRDIDVALAARLAGLPQEEFQALNPQMNKPVILAAGTPMLLLPFDNAQRYQAEVARHRGAFASWTAWVAPRTLKPSEAAQAVGMDEKDLREINRIPPRMLVKAGSTLLVPRHASVQRDVSEHVADHASIALAPEVVPGRKRLAKVGPRGETVASVARRYKVAPAQLARWNGVSPGGSFRGGQQVVVGIVVPKAVATRPAAASVAQAAPAGRQAAGRHAGKAPARKLAKAPARKAVKLARR